MHLRRTDDLFFSRIDFFVSCSHQILTIFVYTGVYLANAYNFVSTGSEMAGNVRIFSFWQNATKTKKHIHTHTHIIMKRFWIAIMSNYWEWREGALCILKCLRHNWNEDKWPTQRMVKVNLMERQRIGNERMKCDMKQCCCCNADECALNKICVRNFSIPIKVFVSMYLQLLAQVWNASIDFGEMVFVADYWQ